MKTGLTTRLVDTIMRSEGDSIMYFESRDAIIAAATSPNYVK